MRYIKGMDIKETPVMAEVMDGNIELVDQQLRELGYKPYEEVVYDQAKELNNLMPNEYDLKQQLVDQLEVVFPEGGLPFKLGYKWVPSIVNNNIVFESVRDANAVGTDRNPILFENYVKLVPNAYYLYEDTRYVYVGLRTDQALSWEDVSADMEEF